MPFKDHTLTEDEIRQIFQQSVDSFGLNHTHDFECRTWRGQNWPEACDCTLPSREPQLDG